MARALITAAAIAAAFIPSANAAPILARDMVKACETASTNPAFLTGKGEGIPQPLKRQAEQCLEVTQGLISKGAENGICPKQPVAPMLATGSVVLYLAKVPADMSLPFPEVAKKALQRYFPCT